MKTCLYKPVFVNPLAYFVFPLLYDMQPKTDNFLELTIFTGRLIITDLTNNQYTSYLNVNTIDFSQYADKRIKIELYTDTGAVVLGEWIISQDTTGVKPIASYRNYDKTNDNEDRAVMKDLTGNGHDIQLYNFEFAESSGYGKYATDFNSWNLGSFATGGITRSSNKFIIEKQSTIAGYLFYTTSKKITYDIPSFKVNITGLNDYNTWTYGYVDEQGELQTIELVNGTNTIPISYNSKVTDGTSKTIGFYTIKGVIFPNEQEIIVEQIPDYKGALVSDGVDDYGLCENFPILTKEKGYTVCAIRKWLNIIDAFKVLASKRKPDTKNGAFMFEHIHSSYKQTSNYGKETDIKKYFDNESLFSCQNSIKYNSELILEKGDLEDSNILSIFTAMNGAYGSAAIYALEIYDRDLTDEEIATVKARMIAEYEEKTGNKYEEETV